MSNPYFKILDDYRELIKYLATTPNESIIANLLLRLSLVTNIYMFSVSLFCDCGLF